MFARHGTPEILRSDNGPQYTSQTTKEFAKAYGFVIITSSPRYPQSNGLAERMVQSIKHLLSRADDPYLALLAYRSTPLPWCALSPAELLMGRRLRTTIPQTMEQLTPRWDYLKRFREADRLFKSKQKENFDSRHRAKELPLLHKNTEVWITSGREPVPGTILRPAHTPISFVVKTEKGEVRRNRGNLQMHKRGLFFVLRFLVSEPKHFAV